MDLSAEGFVRALQAEQSDAELAKIGRYFKAGEGQYGAGDRFIGVRMGTVFALAKAFIDLAPDEIERLMESDIHEARAGAMSIMAKQYQRKSTGPERRQKLYELYLRRHDRINNWDLVDLAAWYVLGPHLLERPRDVLYALAQSEDMWERRSGILATFAFIKRGELDDTMAISELLLEDVEDLIHKAAGGMLREAGRKDQTRLVAFLERHGQTMPRTMLRYAIEHFPAAERAQWMARA
jgi:3-methyladenine DNA glycosylase AlkD